MLSGLIGTKVGMTQVVGDRGRVDPVTVIKAGPCVVLQVKTQETDGYQAVQLGFGDVLPHRSTKPMIGHAGKAGSGPKRTIREFRIEGDVSLQCGDVVTVAEFASEESVYVDVTGVTKGRGFTGVMKRHNFGGKEASHGVERKHRSAGSIGGDAPGATGRGIKKGKRMAGRYGGERCMMSGLRLLQVDAEHDLLLVRGSVPGANGSTVVIRKSIKQKGAG